MEKVNLVVVPKTILMNVNVKVCEIPEALDTIEEQLLIINRIEGIDPDFHFKKYLVENALSQWIREKNITERFVLYVSVRGRVIEVSAHTFKNLVLQEDRKGVKYDSRIKGERCLIVTYTY